MIRDYQNKDEDAKEIGKEAQVLIVKHLGHQMKLETLEG